MRFTSTFSSLRNVCKSHPITFLTEPYVPTFLRYSSISITSIAHTIQIYLLRLNQYIHLYMIRIRFILFISVTAFFHFISPLTLHLYPILNRLRTPFLSFTSDSASFHSFQFSFILQTFHPRLTIFGYGSLHTLSVRPKCVSHQHFVISVTAAIKCNHLSDTTFCSCRSPIRFHLHHINSTYHSN